MPYESFWVRSAGLRHLVFWTAVYVLSASCAYGVYFLWIASYKAAAIVAGVILFPPLIYANLLAIHDNTNQALKSLVPILDSRDYSPIEPPYLREIGIALQKTQIDDEMLVQAESAWIRHADDHALIWGSYLVKGRQFSKSVFAVVVYRCDFATSFVVQYRLPLIRRLFDPTPISFEHDYKINSRDRLSDARDWIIHAPPSVLEEFIELRDFNFESKHNMLCLFYNDSPREAFGFTPITSGAQRDAYWADRVDRVERLAVQLLKHQRYFFTTTAN